MSNFSAMIVLKTDKHGGALLVEKPNKLHEHGDERNKHGQRHPKDVARRTRNQTGSPNLEQSPQTKKQKRRSKHKLEDYQENGSMGTCGNEDDVEHKDAVTMQPDEFFALSEFLVEDTQAFCLTHPMSSFPERTFTDEGLIPFSRVKSHLNRLLPITLIHLIHGYIEFTCYYCERPVYILTMCDACGPVHVCDGCDSLFVYTQSSGFSTHLYPHELFRNFPYEGVTTIKHWWPYPDSDQAHHYFEWTIPSGVLIPEPGLHRLGFDYEPRFTRFPEIDDEDVYGVEPKDFDRTDAAARSDDPYEHYDWDDYIERRAHGELSDYDDGLIASRSEREWGDEGDNVWEEPDFDSQINGTHGEYTGTDDVKSGNGAFISLPCHLALECRSKLIHFHKEKSSKPALTGAAKDFAEKQQKIADKKGIPRKEPVLVACPLDYPVCQNPKHFHLIDNSAGSRLPADVQWGDVGDECEFEVDDGLKVTFEGVRTGNDVPGKISVIGLSGHNNVPVEGGPVEPLAKPVPVMNSGPVKYEPPADPAEVANIEADMNMLRLKAIELGVAPTEFELERRYRALMQEEDVKLKPDTEAIMTAILDNEDTADQPVNVDADSPFNPDLPNFNGKPMYASYGHKSKPYGMRPHWYHHPLSDKEPRPLFFSDEEGIIRHGQRASRWELYEQNFREDEDVEAMCSLMIMGSFQQEPWIQGSLVSRRIESIKTATCLFSSFDNRVQERVVRKSYGPRGLKAKWSEFVARKFPLYDIGTNPAVMKSRSMFGPKAPPAPAFVITPKTDSNVAYKIVYYTIDFREATGPLESLKTFVMDHTPCLHSAIGYQINSTDNITYAETMQFQSNAHTERTWGLPWSDHWNKAPDYISKRHKDFAYLTAANYKSCAEVPVFVSLFEEMQDLTNDIVRQNHGRDVVHLDKETKRIEVASSFASSARNVFLKLKSSPLLYTTNRQIWENTLAHYVQQQLMFAVQQSTTIKKYFNLSF